MSLILAELVPQGDSPLVGHRKQYTNPFGPIERPQGAKLKPATPPRMGLGNRNRDVEIFIPQGSSSGSSHEISDYVTTSPPKLNFDYGNYYSTGSLHIMPRCHYCFDSAPHPDLIHTSVGSHTSYFSPSIPNGDLSNVANAGFIGLGGVGEFADGYHSTGTLGPAANPAFINSSQPSIYVPPSNVQIPTLHQLGLVSKPSLPRSLINCSSLPVKERYPWQEYIQNVLEARLSTPVVRSGVVRSGMGN